MGWRPGVTKFKSSNQRARGKVWTTWPSQYHRIIILHIGVKCWAGEKHRTQGSFVPGSNRAGCTAYIKVIWGQKKNMIDAVTNRVTLRAERKALFAIKYWDSLFVSFIYFYLLYVNVWQMFFVPWKMLLFSTLVTQKPFVPFHCYDYSCWTLVAILLKKVASFQNYKYMYMHTCNRCTLMFLQALWSLNSARLIKPFHFNLY